MYFEPRLSLLSAASAQTISRILSSQGTRGTIILFNEGLTILFPTCRQAAAEFCPQLVPGHTQRDCAKSVQTMFPVAPPSLSMVLKPWRNELRARVIFFAAYQAMLSVNQQIHCRRTTVCSKTSPFLKPQNRVNFMSQNWSRRCLFSL